jgi:hypothetical protein
MSDGKTKIPRCDVAICINAILTDSLKKRIAFFRALPRCLKKGGYLILTVPSLESSLLTRIINNQFRIESSGPNKKISTSKVWKKWNHLVQGNVEIDNVPTKHFLKEELQFLLKNEGFLIEDIQKIEYTWETEFNDPPEWLKDPYPWDWMVLAQKIK